MSARKSPVHWSLTDIPVSGDEFVFAGRPLTAIAVEVGRTPFYAYDRQSMAARVADLRSVMPAALHIHYAMKANPMPAVVRHMSGLVDGLDVASGGELKVALDTPMDRENISFAGPGKSEDELAMAISAGIVINMESEGEMERIVSLGDRLGETPRVSIRINPDFELKTSGMKMSGGPKQFGVDAERVPAMLGRLAELDLALQGFHIFSGSQNLRPDAICEAQEKTVDLAVRLAAVAPGEILKLNIGGGLGIPYFPGDEPLDLRPIGENLERLLPVVANAMPKARVNVELGRYLVGECGIYVCRVIDRKISREQVFLVTDGGLHHHLAASGNFGQVIRKNYPVFVGNRVKGEPREVATVVGPLCTPLDLLADRMEMAVANVGDLIVVLQSGAYGLTASPTAFLSHPPPGEILI